MSPENSSRRLFLQLAAGALAETPLGQRVMASSASATGIPTRPLGRTGIRIQAAGLQVDEIFR